MKGYNEFFRVNGIPYAGENVCKICGKICKNLGEVTGPSNFVATLQGKSSTFDHYACPDIDEAWHKQATEIHLEAQKTHSLILTRLLNEEISSILKSKKPTKEPWLSMT